MGFVSDMVNDISSLKIAVIAWQIPVTGVSIEYDSVSKGIYHDDLLYLTNKHDTCAVEEAIRIRDARGKGTVTVITAGPQRVKTMLRDYLAMGANETISISGQTDGYDIYSLCSFISRVVENGKYDLILCGEETIDNLGCIAYPGPFLAGLLGIPQVSGVTRLDVSTKEIIAQRKMEYGDRQVVRSPLPCLVAVGTNINEPRYPAFPDMLESTRKEIRTLDMTTADLAEMNLTADTVKNVSFSAPRKRVKKTISINTSLSAADRIKMIMSGGLSQKNDRQLLTGDTQKIVQDIISILRNRGIIKPAQ